MLATLPAALALLALTALATQLTSGYQAQSFALGGVVATKLLPAMLLAGILGGMAWAAIPAFLKTRFGVNEILTSLMLTYVATLLLSALVHGPWRDPTGFNLPDSRIFPPAIRKRRSPSRAASSPGSGLKDSSSATAWRM